MKTTLELPEDLVREVKIRAARENRRLKDVVADLIRRGLAQHAEPAERAPKRVRLPLIRTRHPARPEEEMKPDRVASVLIDEEAAWARSR